MATDKDLIHCGTLQKNMNISKDNPEDLIGYNGRLFVAVDLIAKAFDETPAINLVDKIANFFETEENWKALKECWLENDRSDDLRRLLTRAIKD